MNEFTFYVPIPRHENLFLFVIIQKTIFLNKRPQVCTCFITYKKYLKVIRVAESYNSFDLDCKFFDSNVLIRFYIKRILFICYENYQNTKIQKLCTKKSNVFKTFSLFFLQPVISSCQWVKKTKKGKFGIKGNAMLEAIWRLKMKLGCREKGYT